LLAHEGSGILNWCIAGCLEWRKLGLSIPPSISRETAQYRDETDVVGEWIEAECERSPGSRCKVATIYESYRSYFHEVGMSPKSQVAFTRMMGTRGFRRKSSNGKPFLEGIAPAL
jgi:putative DNA primase/helicase